MCQVYVHENTQPTVIQYQSTLHLCFLFFPSMLKCLFLDLPDGQMDGQTNTDERPFWYSNSRGYKRGTRQRDPWPNRSSFFSFSFLFTFFLFSFTLILSSFCLLYTPRLSSQLTEKRPPYTPSITVFNNPSIPTRASPYPSKNPPSYPHQTPQPTT